MTTLSSPLVHEGQQRPTMKDVAALAGVSLKSVSRVVNHEPGVSPDLEAKVRAAAQELGYRPNLTASSLRRSDHRTSTIGLVLDDVANPFFADLHRGIEDVARERGVAVMAASLDQRADREADVVGTFVDRRVDGLIFAPRSSDQSYLETELGKGWPVVCIDRLPNGIDVDAVIADNHEAAMAAARHLLDQGHRRIAFLGDAKSLMTAQQRLAGFQKAMRNAGVAVEPALVRFDVNSLEEGEDAAREILTGSVRPTALFTAQNYVTMGACRALHGLGLQHSVALVGFDDFVMADVLEPRVTVVKQDPRRMGQEAAELLFARMDGALVDEARRIVPCTLIPRGSGEIPPG